MKKSNLIIILFLLSLHASWSQPLTLGGINTVNPIFSNYFHFYLEDDCTDVFDMEWSVHMTSVGQFWDDSSSFIIEDGIFLTCGSFWSIRGPNNSGSTSYSSSGLTDSLLENLTNEIVTDAARLDYKFISQSDLYTLEYVFGSEEYPESLDSIYHDVFGIFVSGPNPAGGHYIDKNFALVPGTNLPVNSYTINSYTNSNFFIDNGDGSTPNNEAVEFDGYTIKLNADIPIIPGEEYHVKIVIGDNVNYYYDSAIFFRAKDDSYDNHKYHIEIESAYGNDNELYEGYDAILQIIRESADLSYEIPVDFYYSGTATPGVDINYINTSQIIPIGQYSISIPLTILDDGINENTESLNIHSYYGCIDNLTTYSFEIHDDYILDAGIHEDTIILCDETLELNTFINCEDSFITYLWSNGNTESFLVYQSNANYTESFSVTITHSDGQQIIDDVFVKSSTGIETVINTIEHDCLLGSINLYAFGGLPPYLYEWSNGNTATSILGAMPGLYTITVTDINNCKDTSEVELFSNPPLENILTVISDCIDSTGNIYANPILGNPPYSYLWNTYLTTDEILIANPGDYFVTITDNNGCELIDSIINFNPVPVNAILNTTNISCYPGSAEIFITSGNPPYHIEWTPGAIDSTYVEFTEAGVYGIEVTDSYSCSYEQQFGISVDSLSLIEINEFITTDPCDSTLGSIEVQVTSGLLPFTFLWSTGSTSHSISNLTPGIYEITITDINACSESWEFEILASVPLSHSLITNNITDCNSNNGSAEIIGYGGLEPYSYYWDTSDTISSVDNLTNYLYYVTISDACGNQIVDYTFPVYEGYLNIDTIVNYPICNSSLGEIKLIEQSSLPFNSWLYDSLGQSISSTSDGIYTNLTPQIYSIVIEDTFNCIDSTIVNLNLPDPGIEIISDPPTAACNGDSVLLSASFENVSSLGYEIDSLSLQLESTGGTNIYPYLSDDRVYGPYSIGFDFSFFSETVSQFYVGSNGWISFSPLSSNNDPWYPIQIPNTSSTYPRNSIMGAYKDWHPGLAGSIKYQTTGSFPDRKLIVSFNSIPSYQCTTLLASFQIVLHENGSLVDVNFVNVPNCTTWGDGLGVSGIQNASGTVAYFIPELNFTQWTASNYTLRYSPNFKWYDSNFDLLGIGQFVYAVIDTPQIIYCSFHNCEDSIVSGHFVDIDNYIPNFNLGFDDTVCYNNYLSVGFDSISTYEWNTGDTLNGISIIESGNYSLTISNGDCSLSDDIYLTVEEVDQEFNYDQSYCSVDGSFITLNPDYEYLWSDGSTDNNYYFEQAGIYTLTMYSDNCIYEFPLDIELSNTPASIFPDSLNVCNSYTVLQAGNASNYIWSNGYSAQNMLINQAGMYYVTLSNAVCETIDSVEVLFYPPAIPYLGQDTTMCYGTIINLNPGSFDQYLWQNGLQLPDINIVQPYTYWVSVTNSYGCTGVDSLIFSVVYDPISDFSFDEAFGTVQFYNESQYATNYMWYFGDGSGIFTENPVHIYPSLPNNEFYTVTLVANNMCGTDTSEFELIIFDILNINDISTIKVYPNPFTNEFTIEGLESDDEIKVYDILGKEIEFINSEPNKVSLGNTKPGVYFLIVEKDQKFGIIKLVKQ